MSDIFINQTLRVELDVTNSVGAIVDISAPAVLTMTFKRPDGTGFSRVATLVTDGTDGKMEYTLIVNELNMIGIWHVQGIVVDGAGEDNPTNIVKFLVLARNV